MTIKTMISPQRYVQGPGALSQIAVHLQAFGVKNPLIVASPSALKACETILADALGHSNIAHTFTEFGRECTFDEIDRIKGLCLDGGHDAIIDCGGGKVMDAGRAAAATNAITIAPPLWQPDPFPGAGVPCIQVPTVASNDAPTASSCVVYDAQGVQAGVVSTTANPNLVLVDTQIIARAPVRTLAAGMGDALATYFEADRVHRSGRQNVIGGFALHTVLTMARLAYDILMEYGLAATREVAEKKAGPALEEVAEANILLSGIGYESGGLAAAHAIAQGFGNRHDQFDQMPYHGELVAFGTLVQLVMEPADSELVDKVRNFCTSVGLPTTLEALGIKSTTDDTLRLVAEDAAKDGNMAAMPKAYDMPDQNFNSYDPQDILDCIKKTDALGQA
ncbi:MAG: glycerol dehydrogenase [Desulfobacterales bacterium]